MLQLRLNEAKNKNKYLKKKKKEVVEEMHIYHLPVQGPGWVQPELGVRGKKLNLCPSAWWRDPVDLN